MATQTNTLKEKLTDSAETIGYVAKRIEATRGKCRELRHLRKALYHLRCVIYPDNTPAAGAQTEAKS